VQLQKLLRFRTFPVQIATSAPEVTSGLSAVSIDMVELLAVVALGSAYTCFNNFMTKAYQLEDNSGFLRHM